MNAEKRKNALKNQWQDHDSIILQGGGSAVKENVGKTGVRHGQNGRETPLSLPCDFYKRAARKRGGALPRGRKLCYNKLL